LLRGHLVGGRRCWGTDELTIGGFDVLTFGGGSRDAEDQGDKQNDRSSDERAEVPPRSHGGAPHTGTMRSVPNLVLACGVALINRHDQ
jgi:hypothetical protein